MYNEAFETGELPATLSQALITLILKKDKDPCYCKSYHPISLIPLDTNLFKTLEIFGSLYNRPEGAVQTNGYISSYFELGRGTHQGSLLSPLLFCLAMEPLAAAIRRDNNFPGVAYNGSVHKLMLYADDVLLLVSEPLTPVPSLLNTINSFSKLSGYKINWDKSEALPLTQYCPTMFFQADRFRWSKQGLQYLSILSPKKLNNIIKANFGPLRNAETWYWYKTLVLTLLSLWGKVNVIKMNCFPRINYLLHSLPLEISSKYFKRFDSIFMLYHA